MTDPASTSVDLRLRPLRLGDEAAIRAAHEEMRTDGFEFAPGPDAFDSWPGYVTHMDAQRRGLDVPIGRVPATFLVAESDGVIVGRSSIRHELNDFLRREGGHIGYGVLAAYRRRGIATEILRQSLIVARALGVDDVLVTCDDDNAGSVAVIERCGGRLEERVTIGTATLRHYWFR